MTAPLFRPAVEPLPRAEIDQAVAFLGTFVDKRKRLGEDAFGVLVALQAEFLLKRAASRTDLSARTADLDAAKDALDTSKQVIDVLVEADRVAHAAYFHAASEYYKVRLCSLHSCARGSCSALHHCVSVVFGARFVDQRLPSIPTRCRFVMSCFH